MMSKDFSYASALRACGESKDFERAKAVYAEIQSKERNTSTYIDNLAIEMYDKCGNVDEACSVFDKMQRRNVFSWTMMIAAFSHNGRSEVGIVYFWRMNLEGVKPDRVAFVTILECVTEAGSHNDMMLIHNCIFEAGMTSDLVVGNALLSVYGACSLIVQATNIFEQMPEKNVITWTCIIAAYARGEEASVACHLFHRMELDGVPPNAVTCMALSEACSKLSKAWQRQEMMLMMIDRILTCGFLQQAGCSVIELYGKLGEVEKAAQVFHGLQLKNVVAWTTLITAYAINWRCNEAFYMFRSMELEGVVPDSITALSIVDACGRCGSLAEAKSIHTRVMELGLLNSCSSVGNSLLNLYGRCGSLECAYETFKALTKKSVVAWTALITANSQTGNPLQCFHLFANMHLEGIKPNLITLVTMLDASSALGDLVLGRFIHEYIQGLGIREDGVVGNALVNMYGKCGSIVRAKIVFDSMKERDFYAWNAMVAAYAHKGEIDSALETMQCMEVEGIGATEVTFISIFSALSHAGLFAKCWECFTTMLGDYAFDPVGEHYRCIVDMLARLGQLQLAKELTYSMPFETSAPAWMSILCTVKNQSSAPAALFSDSNRTEAAKHMLQLEPKNAATYLCF